MLDTTTTYRTGSQPCAGISDGRALLDLARGWLKQGNPIVALDLLKSAIVSNEAEQDQVLRAGVLKETGRARMMQSDWEGANGSYLEAQRLFLAAGEYRGATECARNRANAEFQQGNYNRCEDLCEEALEWATQTSDYELRATVLNTLGAVRSARGEHAEAIKVLKLCLSDFESAGNVIRQGYVLLNIGLTHTEIGEFDQAVENLNGALAVALDEKDLNLVEICYQNIARCHLERGETIIAKSVIDTARKILPGLNSKALEAELNLIDGRILRVMGNIDAAADMLTVTHNMAVTNKMPAMEAETVFEQGLLEKDRGNYDIACAKLDAAAVMFKQIGMDRRFQDSVQVLSNLKRKLNAR
ncbi:MAG TPA: tetratricopeptide repeat protein [candidate division Zixibacteria bacterium]|nr:tetratricopeptide repeat protein [candidate division Zixibacteria bacterium]